MISFIGNQKKKTFKNLKAVFSFWFPRDELYDMLHQFTEHLIYFRFIEVVQGLQTKQFVRDLDLADLLTFSPGTDLHDHVLYVSGDIILQDKVHIIIVSSLN